MPGITYKKLFEVQLLHEYYLSKSDETTVFDDLAKKDAFLANSFDQRWPSVSEEILFQLPDTVQKTFADYRLRLIPTYTGYSVFTPVNEDELADGTLVYKPLVKLPATTNLLVKLSLKNNLLAAVTNKRINRNIPAVYYFTNEDISAGKTFPVLCAGIAAFDSSYTYEQGELYTDSAGNLCLFYINANTPYFLPVKGNGYANKNDELLVPLQFTYVFVGEDKVTKATVELSDHTGKKIRTYEFKSDLPLKKQLLNFNNLGSDIIIPQDAIVSLPTGDVSATIVYSLAITLNDTKKLVQKIIFYEGGDTLSDCWAVINIKAGVSNAAYNLYDAGGLITYRKKPDGTILPAPVFEVRVKSRSAFWRFINDRQGKLKVDAGSSFLQRDGTNNLVSRLPRNASALPAMFTVKDKFGNITEEKFLPNPLSDERISIEGQKIFSDILVAQSTLFPVDTG